MEVEGKSETDYAARVITCQGDLCENEKSEYMGGCGKGEQSNNRKEEMEAGQRAKGRVQEELCFPDVGRSMHWHGCAVVQVWKRT